MKVSGYTSKTKSFAPFRVDIGNTVADSVGPADSSIQIDVSVLPSSARRFIGGISMPDGSVILLPGHSDVAQFYRFNPLSNTITVASSLGAWNGSGSFRGGALLQDRKRIVLAPYSHAEVKVFNVELGTMAGLATGSVVANKFSGAVSLLDGRVLLVPYGETAICFVSADGSAFSRGPAHGEGATAFSGGVLLPDGRVLLVPASSEYFGIFDPVTNLYSRLASVGKVATLTDQWSGGIYAANGKIVMIPGADSRVLVFDPASMAFDDDPYKLATHTGLWYSGGALSPDGRIVFVQNTQTVPTRIYDPSNKTVVDGPLFALGGVFQGGVPTSDGRVLMVPITATSAVVYRAAASTKGFGVTSRTSPWMNKAV
ncbi:hypothetical protein NJH24_18235 [Pseudomonas asiatica]|uniref:hypothetical protein n=1 Tax=Pseudomonas asiatica TaxID=2219225 RepID=UPI00209B495A|nr:hypothetical protein [Pseudomonas asiatica]MCO7536715.1 hypothetical protein [Pseudomonas asiatica]MCO7550470.1 hypothetical protein [Pseudomonas asiatica]MCO7560029.1 hypothetical protein [Pseudomonas asiatica]